tara:strand:- start:1242 stop:1535 length:294 start_codon:yes stop_codon:yes gene_type:complete
MVLRKLLTGIAKIFDTTHPKHRQSYAVTGGKYLGEFFVYMEQTETDVIFLSLPSMDKRLIPKDKFQYAIKNKILDPVEKIPTNIYNLCKEHYKGINT